MARHGILSDRGILAASARSTHGRCSEFHYAPDTGPVRQPLGKPGERTAAVKCHRNQNKAGARWQAKIDTLKASATGDPQAKKEYLDFRYVLQDTDDALKSTIDVAKEYAEAKEPEAEPKKK